MSHSPHICQQLDHAGGPVEVIQLTDTHLCSRTGGTLLGMDTDHSLACVIRQALRERSGVDVLLATGDLSDVGSAAAYQRLLAYFDEVCPRQFWLPGNHDDRAAMVEVCGQRACLANDIRIGSWQLVLLDSQIPGQVGGELGADQLLLLRQALADGEALGLHALVCLHHQPVAIGCDWLDQQMVADADALFTVLAEFPGVKGVLWGHIHQPVDRLYRGLRLLASPSTCVQFAPGSDEFRADDEAPGYRWLQLHDDGNIDTGISRVRDVQFTVNLDQRGYL